MANQFLYVNTGTTANAGNGDSLRTAFSKINENFRWISTNTGQGPSGPVGPSGPTINLSALTSNLVPVSTSTYDIGSPSFTWNTVYASSLTIGGGVISISTLSELTFNGSVIGLVKFRDSVDPIGSPTDRKGDILVDGEAEMWAATAHYFPTGSTSTFNITIAEEYTSDSDPDEGVRVILKESQNSYLYEVLAGMTGSPNNVKVVNIDGFGYPSTYTTVTDIIVTAREVALKWTGNPTPLVIPAGTQFRVEITSIGNTFMWHKLHSGDFIRSSTTATDLTITTQEGKAVKLQGDETAVTIFNQSIQLSVNTNTVTVSSDRIDYSDEYYSSKAQIVTLGTLTNSTVVWTSPNTTYTPTTVKLLVQAENATDSQACELLIVTNRDKISGSVYGIVYTSATPFMTYGTNYNTATSQIQVFATKLVTGVVTSTVIATAINTA